MPPGIAQICSFHHYDWGGPRLICGAQATRLSGQRHTRSCPGLPSLTFSPLTFSLVFPITPWQWDAWASPAISGLATFLVSQLLYTLATATALVLRFAPVITITLKGSYTLTFLCEYIWAWPAFCGVALCGLMKELWTGLQPIWILVMAFPVSNWPWASHFSFFESWFPLQLVDNETILLRKAIRPCMWKFLMNWKVLYRC